MSKNVRTQLVNVVGKSLDAYHKKTKPTIDELKFKEEYQGRIIDCMVGEIDDNYIETPETDAPIVKLEHSREGVVKIPSIKGKTILVDADGNETDTPAEGCRLVSVGEEEDNKLIILSKNKNLFEGEVEQGFINQSTGENINWMEYWRTKDYIQCKPQTIYHSNFVYKGITDTSCTFFYDKNKNFISMAWSNPCTTPKECYFIRLAGQGEKVTLNRLDVSELNNITLYEQNKSDTYIPPKYHKTEILLKEPLRRLPNGVYDEIVCNKLIRRVGRVVLDGTEIWSVHPYEKEGYFNVWIDPFNKVRNMKMFGSTNCEPYLSCNALKVRDNRDLFEELISIHYQPTVKWCYISVSKEKISDIDEFKKWLSENNIEILYELEEPTIEELPNSITLQGFDDTTMYIENSITPVVSYGYNALIPYKEELLQQKEEVEINTLDIENNIIPYLMDMEFNLMTMEDK